MINRIERLFLGQKPIGIIYATLIILIFFSTSWAGSPYIRSAQAYGRQYLYIQDIASYYGLTLVSNSENCEMRNKWNKIGFTFDKREGMINGYKINYLFPPVRENSIPLVSSSDFQFILEPIMRTYSIPKQTLRTIVIDPGHGGKDQGAAGKKYKEKDITLQIAKKLKNILVSKGFKVYLTRESDSDLDLDMRPEKCRSVGADIFISIHCNAVGKRDISGIETFAMTPEGAPSTSDTKPKIVKEKGNASNKNNYLLAYNVHSKLINSTGTVDRGVKHARFVVLRNAPCTALLVETGFISNSYEESKLGSLDYQEKVANAIANGLTRYGSLLLGGR